MKTVDSRVRGGRSVAQRRSPLISFGLLALAALGVAADCQQCQTATGVRVGNIERPSDVVLVTGEDGHTYGVLAHPDLGHLRFVDLTAERFVDAPNLFFPLSVPVGQEVRRLAVAPDDDSRVFALDTASDAVVVVDAARDGEAPFRVVGEPVRTGRSPADLSAVRDASGLVEIWIVLPEEGRVQVIGVAADGTSRGELASIALPPGARPSVVAADPFGESVVVGDAALPAVHILRRDARALDRSIDVGGPVSELTAGVVDVGDGRAPVVAALRADAHRVAVLRLFRPGFREDRYALLGSAPVPAFPLSVYIPDQRGEPTVCCRALSRDAIDAGEATDAWAAVGLADGRFVYVALAAPDVDGRRAVRLMDNDLESLALRPVDNTPWFPEPGDEDRQPVAALVPPSTQAPAPVMPLVGPDETLTLVWEGDVPALSDLPVSLQVMSDGLTITAPIDLVQRGARAGDRAVLRATGAPPGCPTEADALVVDARGASLIVLLAPEALSAEDAQCLIASSRVELSVAAGGVFAAFDGDGVFLGRLALGGSGGPDAALALPGADLVVTPAPDGPPRQRGSVLLVPLDPNLELLQLTLAAPVLRAAFGGGLGQAGYLPVAVVGGPMDIPGTVAGATVRARRMVVATASADEAGDHVLLACDDAETVVALCDQFR